MRMFPDIAVIMPMSEDQRFIVESGVPSLGSGERNEVERAARGVRYAAVAATSRVVIYIDTYYSRGRASMWEDSVVFRC